MLYKPSNAHQIVAMPIQYKLHPLVYLMNIQMHFNSTSNSGGSFPFGKSEDSTFYFPDQEKTVKIFPVREIK